MLLNVIATSSVGSRSLQSENHLNPPPPPMVAPCSNFTSKDRVRSAMELQLSAHHFPPDSCIPTCLLLLSRVTRVSFSDYLAPSYSSLCFLFIWEVLLLSNKDIVDILQQTTRYSTTNNTQTHISDPIT